MASRSSRRCSLAVGALLVSQAACGGSSVPGTPFATPAAPALCELTGVTSVRYRLSTVPEPPFAGGSTISILDPHLEREFPPPRPLAGMIDFVPVRPLPAGARFAVTLAGYALESDGFSAHSAQLPFPIDGAITAPLDDGAGVVASLDLADFGLANQAAPADTIGDGCPPAIDGIELTGQTTTNMRQIKVRLFAVPETE